MRRRPPRSTLFPDTTLFRSVLLHAWTAAFGTSATAVRALSAVFSVLTLPLAWHVARRLAGRRVAVALVVLRHRDRKSTRLNSSHANISYAVFCLKKKFICLE